MDYPGWINTVCALLEYTVVDPASAAPTGTIFDTVYPAAIDYAELRIQRDLDLIGTVRTQTGTLSANSRTATIPIPSSGVYVVIQQVRLIVGGDTLPALEPISREMMDFFWPSEMSPGAGILPQQWCRPNERSIMVGPAPDQSYGFEVVGTARFQEMSADHPNNELINFFPDLYVAASMIWFSGYQRDFGSQADDPKIAQSWENQYQLLKSGAAVEEARKKYAAMTPSPSSTAPVTG